MKIYYFNDTKEPVLVFTDDLHAEYAILNAADGAVFEANIKENQIAFVKVWPGKVLITGMDSIPERV